MMRNVEAVRQEFKPDRIGMLFVGESAPVSGKFFYFANSGMHRYMERAFEAAFGPQDDFLHSFKARGCYLDDLVLTPVSGLARADRRRACMMGEADLTERIKAYRPDVVVCLMKGIEPIVSRAAKDAGVGSFYCTHFPGNGQQGKFASDMHMILARSRALLALSGRLESIPR